MWNKFLCVASRPLAFQRRSSFVSRMRYLKKLQRDDEACVRALRTGHLLLFHRLRPLLRPSQAGGFACPTLPYEDVRSALRALGADESLLEESVLIGCRQDERPDFCLDLGRLDPTSAEKVCQGTFVDLKKSFFLLSEAEAPLVAKGRALLSWHRSNKFCGASGRPTCRNRAGSQRACGDNVTYPAMAPAIIVLVSDGHRCLLARQPSFPPGMYSALAGFCDMGESLEEALRREVAEEVGLHVDGVRYASSQHWPHPRSTFLLGCHAHVSPARTQLLVDRAELEDARWFASEEIEAALRAKASPAAPWLPPKQSVARRLVAEWAERRRGVGEEKTPTFDSSD
ncbi:nucleoside diphosphate-linked moiety X motif 13 isoform X2 [Corythoichthys intestinalis]|uniref:nucleoside diphosphate-linked moiety X motif 13 isoform X2 n=1 Tax=Corythoichthys intestinalis TaxID=161448 RepID=UPI0025A5AB74|nr:nucleoside diphosphate-linked moiety X motif 13 isoform X2 [Corythoichthys intestinalis]XP_057681312.1 nucleoside diphosphate-linked moiety X motif 13 isoform X2 [Corythoichthys intestinalis]XP_057681313.1 nucleoside diphosphate-linked moiety X motif 13 isoform X2 [Corythoichthys intestinalis]XP_057681314.1 nucleoside diphosphate-linked moiety X motif 13 isoform X2 [Corythoichthys intestinalis]XP_061807861.1 nucleoside diphosphate-linked moiety X motif 13 [Nerophis lumbriciformis]